MEIDAFAPGSLGSLSPDFENGEDPLDGEEALELFLEWVEARGLTLWEHQEEALLSIAMGNHVVLGTPTGSGKSLVAVGMCFIALAADYTSYYTAPIKALVSEKFFELVDLFGRDMVGMITGDVAINPNAPVVCCTAEILANQALREGEDTSVAWVVMDEFHYYGDPDRGWAWQVPLLALRNTKFLLMAALLKALKPYLIPAAAFILAFAAEEVVEKKAYSDGGWPAYVEYNDARSSLVDFYTPPYSQIRKEMKAAGISRLDYNLMVGWKFCEKDYF